MDFIHFIPNEGPSIDWIRTPLPDLVVLFVNTVAFECRRAASSAFRSLRRTTVGTPQSRAEMRPPYDPLGTLPYLRTGPLRQGPSKNKPIQ